MLNHLASPTTTATFSTPICDHLKAPGIDADFCPFCRVWYPAEVIARQKPAPCPEPPKTPLSVNIPAEAPSMCEFCALSVGTLLCDGRLGAGKMCDRLMCRKCAGEPAGVVFVCQRPAKKSTTITHDLCPNCRKQPESPLVEKPPEPQVETLPDAPVANAAWYEAKANVYLQTMNRVAVSTSLTPEAKRHEMARLMRLRDEALKFAKEELNHA